MLRLNKQPDVLDVQAVERPAPPRPALAPSGNWCYVGAAAALPEVPRRQRAVLGGELVIVSLDAALNPGHGFVRQRARRAHHWLALGQAPQLHVWVHPEAVGRKGLNAELLIDHYLANILSSSASGIYLGAISAGDTTSALALVYDKRRIVKVADFHNLPGMQTAPKRLSADLAAIAADIGREHPGMQITTLAPLAEDNAVGHRHIPDKVLFRRARRARLSASAPQTSAAALWTLSGLLAAGGVGFYGHTYVQGYGELAAARAQFAQARQGLPEQAQQAPLQLLEAQRDFLAAPAAQVEAAASVEPLLRHLAQEPELRVESLTRYFNAAARAKDQPEAEFLATVIVPADTGIAALAQGRDLLSRLAASTGYELTLAPQGWAERSETVRGKPRAVRAYIFSGARSAKATGR